MKRFFISVIVVVAIAADAKAQSLDNIVTALRSGNASELAGYFQSNVEISVKDAQNSYSKSQAEIVLRNFFSSHVPKSFNIVHQGSSPEGSKYFIGNLVTSAGTYRTYVYAKQTGSAYVILEIRFEEQ